MQRPERPTEALIRSSIDRLKILYGLYVNFNRHDLEGQIKDLLPLVLEDLVFELDAKLSHGSLQESLELLSVETVLKSKDFLNYQPTVYFPKDLKVILVIAQEFELQDIVENLLQQYQVELTRKIDVMKLLPSNAPISRLRATIAGSVTGVNGRQSRRFERASYSVIPALDSDFPESEGDVTPVPEEPLNPVGSHDPVLDSNTGGSSELSDSDYLDGIVPNPDPSELPTCDIPDPNDQMIPFTIFGRLKAKLLAFWAFFKPRTRRFDK